MGMIQLNNLILPTQTLEIIDQFRKHLLAFGYSQKFTSVFVSVIGNVAKKKSAAGNLYERSFQTKYERIIA